MPIDPISGTAALVGAFMDMQAKNAATEQAYANLNFQKQNADRQYQLSTAGKTDAYGDKLHFNPATNEWETTLSPQQEALAKSGEREQLLGLTRDATNNRIVRERALERGRDAATDYNKTESDFRYGGPPSEDSIRQQLTSLLSGSADSARMRGLGNATSTALRTGSRIPNTRSVSEDAGSSLSDILLKAREGARGEFASRQQQHQQQTLPVMQQLAQLMDAGGNAPVQFSNTPDKLMAQQGNADQLIQAALKSGASGVQTAGGALSKTLGADVPNFSGLSSLINALGPSKTGGKAGNTGIGTAIQYDPTNGVTETPGGGGSLDWLTNPNTW